MTDEAKLPKLVYNLKEVQQMLGVSRTTIWKWVKRGKLKSCNLGIRKPMFTLEAIRNLLSGNHK